jgi:hypothetical protein
MVIALRDRMRIGTGRVFATCLVGGCLAATEARAQSTYFEVPSGDVPERKQMIAQAQAAANDSLDLSGMVVVGVGSGFEVGASVANLLWERSNGDFGFVSNARRGEEPLAPLLLLTSQKLFRAEERWQVTVGVQTGTNVARAEDVSLVARAYALLVLDLDERGRCSAGPYVASTSMLGQHQNFGGFLGCEIELVPRKFGFEGEWDASASALGKLSIGPRIHLGSWGALAVAAQIPNAWGSAEYRGVAQLEITHPGPQE